MEETATFVLHLFQQSTSSKTRRAIKINMQVAVWDTYVKKRDGSTLHFDIIVPNEVQEPQQIFHFGKKYLAAVGEPDGKLETEECQFCHIEQPTEEMLDGIRQQGFYILEMEDIPADLPAEPSRRDLILHLRANDSRSRFADFRGQSFEQVAQIFQNLKKTALALLVLTLLQNCANPPDYPDAPVIEFKAMSKNRMFQNSKPEADSISLTFTFTDGDGDLGSDDSVSVFITDGRDGFPKPPYKIPYIDEQGAGNGISGEITIRLNTTCCTFSNGFPPCSVVPAVPLDTLTYKVYIRDRAGHLSNTIETPLIFLECK